jgi:O-antigen/teichoic acid export membrane protein
MLFAVIMLATAINMNGPVILVARLLGGAAVATLVTARTLANVTRMVPTILCWALWPELTRLDAVGDRDGLRTAHGLLVASYLWISIIFVGAFWFEGPGLIELWTRGRLSVEPWLVRAFLLYVLCQAPWIASSMLAWATTRHRKLAWCQLLAGIAGVVFAALFLPRLRLVAVPLGLLAGEALTCYHFVIADACTLTDTPYRQFATRVWFTLAFVTTLTLTMSAVAHRLPVGFVPLRVLIAGIVSVITATAGVWTLLLDKSGRLLVAGRFTRGLLFDRR